MSGLAPIATGEPTFRLGGFVPTHEVAALQPAAREQEPRGRQPGETTAMARWQGQHDQLMYCRRATHDQEQQGSSGQAGTLMRRVTSTPPSRNDKVVLTNSANQVCLNVPWIFLLARIDPHHATEHRSTDQSRNCCGMCCFWHAQPFEITRAKNIKILLCNVHAKTRKLWKHFARAASTIEIATNIRSP